MASMFSSVFFFFFLFFFDLRIGHGFVKLEASDHVHRKLQSVNSTYFDASQPYRTAYHFQPSKNWMNDPNGPMFYKGIYHLFYQHNPNDVVWGRIVWGHSTSNDLINWTPHEIALYPSQPYDINGSWSGSATFLQSGKPVILYTGINTQNQQVQNLALPKNESDPYLIEWIKSPKNPLMTPTPENQIDPNSFRDPSTGWLGPDGRWRVIVGSKTDRQGLAILYRSKDFVYWVKSKHALHSARGTAMWECPDFFPVSVNNTNGLDTSVVGSNVKHVLKVSDTITDRYAIGTYNISKDRFSPDEGTVEGDAVLRYDYGKFYASKTFFDSSTNRRILWGWISESSSVEDDRKKGWSGVQSFPRTLWLDKSQKQLMQWPIKEIEKLRLNSINFPTSKLQGGSMIEVSGVTAARADVEISFEISDFSKAEVLDPSWTNPQLLCSQKGASTGGNLGPFGLLVLASKGMQEYTAVFFRIFKDQKNQYAVLMCSDQSRSSLNQANHMTIYGAFVNADPVREKLSLRSLIDHSIVESFGGGGKSCITARVYPTLAINNDAHLYAFNNGTQSVNISRLSAWSMKKAKIN